MGGGHGAGTVSGALLGRRREQELLDRLVSEVSAGQSRVLVLRGPAGVGKTALLDSLVDGLAGWQVVTAAGVESEMQLAHSGLHQLCAPLLDHLDQLPPPQRDALRVVFGISRGPAPDRFLVALATLSLVAAAADAQPLACIVDDAQWLDAASAQILGFVGRRLLAERVALVCAARTGSGDDVLPGLPTLTVDGLAHPVARALLLGSIPGPLDPAVTDRIVAESRGNPLALLELPRTWTAETLAGGYGLPDDAVVTSTIEDSYAHRLGRLPADTRLLVLTAAAEPLGDVGLLRGAAERLGVDLSAAAPAVDAGLLQVGGRVRFAHPLVRSAAYCAAPVDARRRVHAALAEATDGRTDPDRRAWHRACAAAGADEAVAAELTRSAGRAQARGGLAAAAAFLRRATELTPEPGARAQRALQAAEAALQAGAFETARALLVVAREGPGDDRRCARIDLLEAQLPLVSRRGNDAAPLLLSAARRLEQVDPALARRTYLDAFSAAQFAARLNDGVVVEDLARAARSALAAAPAPLQAGDLLLDAFAALVEDRTAAVPVGRRALAALVGDPAATSEGVRLLWQGSVLALELWHEDDAYALSERHLQVVRRAGALSELPLALSSFIPVLVFCGEIPAASALVHELASLQAAAGAPGTAYGALTHSAWRGRVQETMALADVKTREARARQEGIGIAVCEYARAVLCNSLGRYEEALVAARTACAEPHELVVHNWALGELVEAAARAGRTDLAVLASDRLTARAAASGTPWALGLAARARALVSEGTAAEEAFVEAVDHLGRSRARADLARAHLLHGEWLRRADRRTAARGQLGTAYEMSTGMGLDGFAERSRRELMMTGATVRARTPDPRDELTSQELHIARLARDGLSNPEIGGQLFLSARTVEWHLRKVFSKLGISSRRELAHALADEDGGPPAP